MVAIYLSSNFSRRTIPWPTASQSSVKIHREYFFLKKMLILFFVLVALSIELISFLETIIQDILAKIER